MASRSNLVRLDLRGMKAAQAWTLGQIRKLKNLAPVLEDVAEDFYTIEREWLDSEGGGRWTPLSPRYAAMKARRAPGKPILRLTDRMYREFTGATRHFTVRRANLQIYVLGVPYWVEHQEGDPSIRLPQREVIPPWMAGRQDHWADMITRFIAETLR